MPCAVELRRDFDAPALRVYAKRCSNAKQARRLLSIAAIYDGMSRGDAAKIGGMDRQILRDWVLRFNEAGPDGLIDKKAPGPKRRLNEAQMKELEAIVETGPDRDAGGLVRWRCCDLRVLIEERFGVTYKERAIAYLLKELDDGQSLSGSIRVFCPYGKQSANDESAKTASTYVKNDRCF